MEYAFRVFAAIYDHRVVDPGSVEEARTFFYGDRSEKLLQEDSGAVRITARYTVRRGNEPIDGLSKTQYAGEDFYLFYGLDLNTQQPDWLGEIFEWLSSSHERNILRRDGVGRVPDSEMVFQRFALSPFKPQVALQMAWLENLIRDGGESDRLPKAPSPSAGGEHLVICSHDVDFCFTNRCRAIGRLAKNLGIAWLVYRSWSYFRSNLGMLWKLAQGERIGDFVVPLCEKLAESGCHSTFFVVPVRGHRRDPTYALEQLEARLDQVLKRGFSVAVHGSYRSVIDNGTLAPEATQLERVTGSTPRGGRQHWLRFDSSEHLFRTVEDSGLWFDSSMGFSDSVGFRNGACFAFPPYDFANERPYNFLEIPMAIMDGGLFEHARNTGLAAETLAERVLEASRARGWGGISILWHNPLEPLSVPDEINRVFWECEANRRRCNELWVSADEFISLSLPRYQRAGLLNSMGNRGRS